jgi:hypothetical protein
VHRNNAMCDETHMQDVSFSRRWVWRWLTSGLLRHFSGALCVHHQGYVSPDYEMKANVYQTTQLNNREDSHFHPQYLSLVLFNRGTNPPSLGLHFQTNVFHIITSA